MKRLKALGAVDVVVSGRMVAVVARALVNSRIQHGFEESVFREWHRRDVKEPVFVSRSCCDCYVLVPTSHKHFSKP